MLGSHNREGEFLERKFFNRSCGKIIVQRHSSVVEVVKVMEQKRSKKDGFLYFSYLLIVGRGLLLTAMT